MFVGVIILVEGVGTQPPGKVAAEAELFIFRQQQLQV
jgi:hypothetical protein